MELAYFFHLLGYGRLTAIKQESLSIYLADQDETCTYIERETRLADDWDWWLSGHEYALDVFDRATLWGHVESMGAFKPIPW